MVHTHLCTACERYRHSKPGSAFLRTGLDAPTQQHEFVSGSPTAGPEIGYSPEPAEAAVEGRGCAAARLARRRYGFCRIEQWLRLIARGGFCWRRIRVSNLGGLFSERMVGGTGGRSTITKRYGVVSPAFGPDFAEQRHALFQAALQDLFVLLQDFRDAQTLRVLQKPEGQTALLTGG